MSRFSKFVYAKEYRNDNILLINIVNCLKIGKNNKRLQFYKLSADVANSFRQITPIESSSKET